MTVLVVDAPELLDEALERAGDDGDVIVIDESPARLDRLERDARDPRVWFLLGSREVLPLPDRFVDAVLAPGATEADGPELRRVLR